MKWLAISRATLTGEMKKKLVLCERNSMPKKGWKSITLPEEVYEFFREEWLKQKTELWRKGIRSFSGFVCYMLSTLIEQKKKEKS